MASVVKYETSKGETRYRVRYRKPDGTQTDKRGFKRKVDAVNWAAEHVTVAKAKGAYIDPRDAKATVGELSGAWLDAKRTRVKPSYMDDLEASYRNWVQPEWGGVPVGMVARKDVQQWVTKIVQGVKDNGKSKGGKTVWIKRPRSASVVIRAYGILAGILDDAVRDGRVPANNARGVELPRKVGKRRVYLTLDELFALAGEAGWRRDVVLVLGLCGMRWGELVPLRVGDVDLAKRRIRIEVSAPMVGGVPTPGDTKTHESRTIMYPTALDAVMAAHCKDKDAHDLLFESPRRPGEMMREEGKSSREDGWLRVALRRAGIAKRITLHDLRHTAASLMVASGANVKAVQRQLGHKSAAMTLDVYSDLFDDDLEALSVRMGEMIDGSGVGKMWAKTDLDGRNVKR